MSENNVVFEKIEELNIINEEIKKKINFLWAFDKNFIFVTEEDKVFCCGNNSHGLLGFSHQNLVENFTFNKHLSNKQIIDIKKSLFHTIGRSSDGKLYCWGNELCSRNGKRDNKIYEPKLNEYLNHEIITDYCCGGWHTLVLTINNEVYAWGANDYEQIGIENIGEYVLKPSKVCGFREEKVKAISCGSYHSMALTESGNVYSWGYNNWGQLGINDRKIKENQPKLILIEVKINKIICGQDHSLFLSHEGDIYVFGNNELGQLGIPTKRVEQFAPIKIDHSEKFKEVASHYRYNISAALSKKNIYYIWGQCGEEGIRFEPERKDFKTFDEIFLNYWKITYKTLDLSHQSMSELGEKPEKIEFKSDSKETRFEKLSTRRELHLRNELTIWEERSNANETINDEVELEAIVKNRLKMDGNPLPLIEKKEGYLVLNEATLCETFENSDIANIDVAILHITGDERTGKSFTLNYFLRYLSTDNFGEVNEELKGFEWKGGYAPQTRGVYIWPKPFFKTIHDKKVAIIVMDTQGAYGDNTKDDLIMIPFSLSVSTLLMYNVGCNLNSNVLQQLEIILRRTPNKKIFQNLIFFVRDWALNNKYGFDGGQEYLSKKLNGKDELTYQFMKTYFDTILCYLWPSPGYGISEDNFRGSLSELDHRFVKHLKTVIPLVIEKLLLGTHLKGMELGQHIRDCFQSIIKNEPLISIVEVHVSNNLANIINFIISREKIIFNGFLEQFNYNSNKRDSENLQKIIEMRKNLEIEALKVFETQSDQNRDIYERKLHQLKVLLHSGLDEIERCFLSIRCYESIRRLRKYNANEFEHFVNGSFFGRFFKKKSEIIQKSKELQKTVEDELANYPELDSLFSDKSIIDFTDDLNESLKYSRIGAIASFATSVTIVAARFLIPSMSVISVTSGAAASGSFIKGKAPVTETVEETVNFSEKRGVGGILKDMALLVNRYVAIGGDVMFLVERAKIQDNNFKKKETGNC